MNYEPLFSGRDLELMLSLKFDESAEPSFHIMKRCLVWTDESIANLTSAAYESVGDLWITRGYLHRGLELSDPKIDPYFRDIWERALQQIPDWPGFKRVTLDEEDRDYFQFSMEELAEMERTGEVY